MKKQLQYLIIEQQIGDKKWGAGCARRVALDNGDIDGPRLFGVRLWEVMEGGTDA